jgi:hypothetical protein
MLPLAGMAGWTRDCGRKPAKNLGALAGLVFGSAACSAAPSESPPVFVGPDFEVAGGASIGPSTGPSEGGAAGATGIDGGFGIGVTCTLPQVSDPVFGAQTFSDLTPARPELFAWATDEQAAALRKDQVLFPPSTHTDPVAATLQGLQGFTVNGDMTGQVATILSASLGSARVAWPEPWAVRIGPQGEDPGKNLIRIVLKPEAWVAVVENGTIEVLDMQNERVQLADAAAAPERLGAIVHQRDGHEGGPTCNVAAVVPGTSVGFREFLVSNLGMVQEWSLGTEQIRAHLESNIDDLSKFLARTRPCPNQTEQLSWNEQVVCSWRDTILGDVSEMSVYQQALASPTSDYFDAPPQLSALIDKLQGDLFEPDPLVVTPGSP